MTANAFMIGVLGILAAATLKFGFMATFNLYVVPYWFFVLWLDVVTYLHHHGSDKADEKMPWYRGEVRGTGAGCRRRSRVQFRHVDIPPLPLPLSSPYLVISLPSGVELPAGRPDRTGPRLRHLQQDPP